MERMRQLVEKTLCALNPRSASRRKSLHGLRQYTSSQGHLLRHPRNHLSSVRSRVGSNDEELLLAFQELNKAINDLPLSDLDLTLIIWT
ncbi:hypothetical protein HZ326_21883 [Fusarium oxysporum f. sp. albedinis]|nr:Uncharacterized protein HZ326_22358 [Fusarium oxysporum f. sp. albedinis]KAJ0135074.1 hypothetical protein HZ326_21883 [Fusarium oxysporum f. sp. albedinis]